MNTIILLCGNDAIIFAISIYFNEINKLLSIFLFIFKIHLTILYTFWYLFSDAYLFKTAKTNLKKKINNYLIKITTLC